MPTELQFLADNVNRAKISVPTDDGKPIANLNAMKHGFLSQQILLPSEDTSEFEAFQEGLKADLQPSGALEIFLFSQIVSYAWRLRRGHAIERSLLSLGMAREKVDRAYEKARNCFEGYIPQGLPDGRLVREMAFSEAAAEETEGRMERDSPSTILGAGFSRGESGYRLLSRYETSLTRNLTRNLGLYFQAQRTRVRRLKESALLQPPLPCR